MISRQNSPNYFQGGSCRGHLLSALGDEEVAYNKECIEARILASVISFKMVES